MVQDECRYPDRRQDVADVDRHVHPRERKTCARTSALAEVVHDRSDLLPGRVRRRLSGDFREAFEIGRLRGHLVESRTVLGLGHPPRVVMRPEGARLTALEDERPRPLGVRRGEEDAHRRALRHTVDRRALRADGVHDGAHVVHANFEQRSGVGGVGHPRAPLVEVDQPRERGDAFVQRAEERHLPGELDVRGRAGDEHDVERSVAGDAVGDADVAAARITDFRDHCREIFARKDRGPDYNA